MSVEIPYPPVFHDWQHHDERRVATSSGLASVNVEMLKHPFARGEAAEWQVVELTEEDACLMAASLLQRAGEKKLSRKVLAKLNKNREGET